VTRQFQETPDLSASDTKVLTDIQSHGWHVVKVFSRQNEKGPEWAFSVGLLHSFGHPEVIVFGLPLDICMRVVNAIGEQVRAGKRFTTDGEYDDILNAPYRCAFRPVEQKYYREYVGYAQWFYEDTPFPLAQCFWPDKAGRFPWDAACSHSIREAQPLLFVP